MHSLLGTNIQPCLKNLTSKTVFNLVFGDQVEVEAQSKVYLIHKHVEQIRHTKGPAHKLDTLPEISVTCCSNINCHFSIHLGTKCNIFP